VFSGQAGNAFLKRSHRRSICNDIATFNELLRLFVVIPQYSITSTPPQLRPTELPLKKITD